MIHVELHPKKLQLIQHGDLDLNPWFLHKKNAASNVQLARMTSHSLSISTLLISGIY